MTNQATIQYLRRAGIGYMVAGLSVLAMGIPYWLLGRTIYDNVKMHPVFGPIQQVDNLSEAIASGWGYHVATFAMLLADYSLWKIGEPIGRANRYFLLVPFAGSILHVFTIMFPFPFAPAGTFLNAVGMILVGIVSSRSAVWRGWKRFTPLYVGIFPFVVQFPLLFVLGTPPYHVLPLWGIPGALLGFAAWQRAKEVATLPQALSTDLSSVKLR